MIILGNTGAGKSTLVNYLVGCPLRSFQDPKISLEELFDATNPVAKIGHGAVSLTRFPETFTCPESGLTYSDCPGFFDNRGAEFDIANMYAIARMVSVAKSVKGFIVVVNYHSLNANRGKGAGDAAEIISAVLQDQTAQSMRSVMLLVSGAAGHVTLENLRAFACSALEAYPHMSEAAARCEFYDPLDRYSSLPMCRIDRKGMIERIKEFPGLLPAFFNFSISPESKVTFLKLLDALSAETLALLDAADLEGAKEMYDGLCSLQCLNYPEADEAVKRLNAHIEKRVEAFAALELENFQLVQMIGDHFPAVKAKTVDVLDAMGKKIEEKKRNKERVEVAEHALHLAQQEKDMMTLEVKALQEKNEAARLETERELAKLREENTRIREENGRMQTTQHSSAVDLGAILSAMAGHFGGMGAMGGMPMGGMPMGGMPMGGMDGMMNDFSHMSMGDSCRPRSSRRAGASFPPYPAPPGMTWVRAHERNGNPVRAHLRNLHKKK